MRTEVLVMNNYVMIFDLMGVLFQEATLAPIDTAVSIAQKGHAKNYPLYILSNADLATLSFLRAQYPTIYALFDDIIVPAYAGYKKPDRTMFLYLLHKHALDPNVCIFIDDSQRNIEAAESLGIRSFLYQEDIVQTLQRLHII
jgi:2-haloacid dehalogenase